MAAPAAKEIKFWNDFEPTSQLKVDNSSWQSILDKYLDTSHASGIHRFNYAAVSSTDKALLASYIAQMQSMEPRQLNRARSKAYWFNLFNAAVVYEILDKEARESVRELGNRLWRSNRFNISMQKMSLDDIEHGILRPIFDDPRVHFGFIAGTIGAANLPAQAFSAENVEDLLEANTRTFLSQPRGVRTNGEELILSTVFKWYRTDFGQNIAEVKNFIKQYVSPETAELIDNTQYVNYQYDWSLNKP